VLRLNFIYNSLFTQNKNIPLPNGIGFEVRYIDTSITPIFSIDVTQKGKVSFEDIDLLMVNLNDTISKYLFKFPSKILNIKAYIYAHKKIPYQQIEDLKYEITKGSLFKIVYITDAYDEKLKGIPFRLHRTSIKKKVIKKEQDEIVVDIPFSMDIGEEIIENLYDLNFKKVKELLKKCNYSYVKIYHKSKVIINGQEVSLKKEKEIYSLLKGKDFIFLEADNKVSYSVYLKNLSVLHKSFSNDEALFPFIEISSELQEIIEDKKIKF
tara:strand:+ start:8488 stop:9288 length:801 start_codon:yes stop_codon:yes gene_type:complete